MANLVTTNQIYQKIYDVFGLKEDDFIKKINIEFEANSFVLVKIEKYIKKEEIEDFISVLEKYRLTKDDNQQPTA